MIIDNKIASLGKVVSNDKTRPALTNIQFKGKHAIATDGYMLGIVELDEEVKGERYIPGKLIAKQPKPDSKINFDKSITIHQENTITTPEEFEGQYPNVEPILEGARANNHHTITLGHAVLKKLVDVIKLAGDYNKTVRLSFSDDPLKPVHGLVRCGDHTKPVEMILMPVRDNKDL